MIIACKKNKHLYLFFVHSLNPFLFFFTLFSLELFFHVSSFLFPSLPQFLSIFCPFFSLWFKYYQSPSPLDDLLESIINSPYLSIFLIFFSFKWSSLLYLELKTDLDIFVFSLCPLLSFLTNHHKCHQTHHKTSFIYNYWVESYSLVKTCQQVTFSPFFDV